MNAEIKQARSQEARAAARENVAGPPQVAVVVPSYNHAPFVERCLRSIMMQTHAPSSLLVIDDGSQDGSPEIIARTLASCPFSCEMIARPNRGLPATLNEGLARTRGDYFAYLGSDDVWLPEFLRARVELLESRPHAVVAYGHACVIDEQDRIIDHTRRWAHYVDGDARAMLLQAIGPHSPTVVYRRAALERERWHEQSRLEDYDLYLRLSTLGEFAFDARELSAWRQHGTNTSRDFTLMMDEWLAAQRRTAPQLGLTEAELDQMQTALRWRCAEDYTRSGDKTRALALLYHNWRGAPSATSVAKMLARLLMPHRMLRRYKSAARRRSSEHDGSISSLLKS